MGIDTLKASAKGTQSGELTTLFRVRHLLHLNFPCLPVVLFPLFRLLPRSLRVLTLALDTIEDDLPFHFENKICPAVRLPEQLFRLYS